MIIFIPLDLLLLSVIALIRTLLEKKTYFLFGIYVCMRANQDRRGTSTILEKIMNLNDICKHIMKCILVFKSTNNLEEKTK